MCRARFKVEHSEASGHTAQWPNQASIRLRTKKEFATHLLIPGPKPEGHLISCRLLGIRRCSRPGMGPWVYVLNSAAGGSDVDIWK